MVSFASNAVCELWKHLREIHFHKESRTTQRIKKKREVGHVAFYFFQAEPSLLRVSTKMNQITEIVRCFYKWQSVSH